MKTSFKSTLALIIAMSFQSAVFAAPSDQVKADAGQIDTACAQDAKTAGCGSDQVGSGLLKCMAAYKKANKSFKYSASCRSAMKQMHVDRKANKKTS